MITFRYDISSSGIAVVCGDRRLIFIDVAEGTSCNGQVFDDETRSIVKIIVRDGIKSKVGVLKLEGHDYLFDRLWEKYNETS